MVNAARTIKVLSNPLRLQILFFLEENETTVNTIASTLKQSQATTSHHLNILFDAGLLSRREDGTSKYYSLSTDRGRKVVRRLRDSEELWQDPSTLPSFSFSLRYFE